MKLPICGVCAETSSLCSGCQQKVSSGQLSQDDVQVSVFLKKNENAFPLQEAIVYKAVPLQNIVVLFVEDAAPLIGKGGRVAKAMGQSLGKRVKVIEKKASAQQNVAELLLPAKLLGINEVYKEGRKEYKVRVAKKDANKLPAKIHAISQILQNILGANADIVFD